MNSEMDEERKEFVKKYQYRISEASNCIRTMLMEKYGDLPGLDFKQLVMTTLLDLYMTAVHSWVNAESRLEVLENNFLQIKEIFSDEKYFKD